MLTLLTRRLFCILIGLCLIPPFVLAGDAPSPPYALVNARIVPVEGAEIASGTLVMRDGHIVAVGTDVAVPSDAIILDAEGWTLYPGFVDAHSILGMPTPADPPAAGVARAEAARKAAQIKARGEPTPGLRPELTALELYRPGDDELKVARRSGITAAAIAPRDGILRGQSAVVALHDGIDPSRVIRARWAQHMGFEPSTEAQGLYPRTLMGALAAIRQHVADARWYDQAWRHQVEAPESMERPEHHAGLSALGPTVNSREPVVFTAFTDNSIHRVLRLADEIELNAIVSGAIDGWMVADELAKAGRPVLVSLDHRPRRDPVGFGFRPGGLMQNPGADDKADAVANAGRLHAAGVRFAFTSAGLEKPADFLPNLRKAVEAGLPRQAALEALTTVPASVLGIENQLGSLEAGKAAHIVAVQGDLFDQDATVAAVWIDGRRYDVESSGEKSAEQKTDDDEAPAVDLRERWERRAPKGPVWPEASVTAIRHATLLPVTQGTIPSGTVLIENGRISAVGPDANVTIPSGAREIDATGLYVMPGIIDPHSHLTIVGGGNEGSESVTPEVRIVDVIDHRSPSIFRALAGGVTTIMVLHGSANVIGGENAVIKLRWGRKAEELFFDGAHRGIKFALGENPKRSNSPRTPGVPARYPGTRMGVELMLRAGFTQAQQYQEELEAYEAATARGEDPPLPRRNLRLETLVDVLEGKILVHAHCYRADEILMLLRVADDFGFKITTLEHVLEGYKVADEIAAHGAGGSAFSDGWGYKMEAYDAIPYNVALMSKRGVRMSINSDSVGEMTDRMYVEAAKGMKYGGMTETEALELITLNPAIHLGIDERVGSIEVGKDADLAVLTAHPFSADAAVRYTLIDGQIYFDRDKVEKTMDALAGLSEDTAPTEGGNEGEAGRTLDERFASWQAPWETSGDGLLRPAASYGDASAPTSFPSDSIALVGGRLITMAGPVVESGTIVIANGKIAAIGADVEPPAGATIIRVDGRTITPGLINAGTTVGISEIGAVSATQDVREIQEVNSSVKASVAVHAESEMIPITRVNGVTTTVTAPEGGLISGQSVLLDLVGWTPIELTARSPLAMHIAFPENLDLAPEKKAREQVEEKRKTLREWMRRARSYAGAMAAGTTQRSEDHDELEALVPVVRGELPVIIGAESEEGIRGALEFVKAFGLRAILAGNRDVWRVVDEIKAANVPVILGPLESRPAPGDPYDAIFVAAKLLHDAGVPFTFRTGGAAGARNLAYTAGLAVAFGLPREAAWNAMTRGAAEILGVADLYGTLEVGRVANLVVADGDLLDVPTTIERVVIRGQDIDLSSRHTRLYEKFRARPRTR